MLNKFMVSSRLTADPEIQTVGESRYCKFLIACDRPKRKGEEIHFTGGKKNSAPIDNNDPYAGTPNDPLF